jgi:hypothetical protein
MIEERIRDIDSGRSWPAPGDGPGSGGPRSSVGPRSSPLDIARLTACQSLFFARFFPKRLDKRRSRDIIEIEGG